MVWEYFSRRGWFDFSAASQVISDFFQAGRTLLAPEESGAVAVADLMHLNAAETEVGTRSWTDRFWDRLERGPVEVSETSAHFAVETTDSGPFVGHDPRENPRLSDVTLVGGDASKLAWLAGTDSVGELADRFEDVAIQLADLYRGLENRGRFQHFRSLPMRALLWRAKIAVLLDEEDYEARIDRVHEALR